MSSFAVRSIAAIQPRVKPDMPPTTQHVDCPYPSEWGPGLDQTRTGTFNYVTFAWDMTPWVTVGGQCQLVPAKPAETQHLDCGPGFTGPGYDQARTCTFNYTTGVWECTPWVTVGGSCVPAQIVFTTPSEHMVPSMGGSPSGEDQVQDYGPYSVTNGPWTMTLTFHGYTEVVGTDSETGDDIYAGFCDLTVAIAGATGRTVSVAWDRDYATFPDVVLDASGEAHWLHRPLSEWTDNPTSFTVTLHGE